MVAAITVGLLVHARAWVFVCDDAFISFRYAENLAEHGSLAFNVHIDPPERVEGYTNFLWVLVLGLGAMVGLAPPALAPVLTMIGAAATLAMVTWLVSVARRRGGNDSRRLLPVDLIPAAILVAQPELVVWSHSGLETSAAAALVIGAMAAWLDGRIRLAAGLAAAAVLTRPDAALPIGVCGLVWLAVVGGPVVARERAEALRSIPWRRVLVAAAIFVVPVAAHLLWRKAYYGSWVPNTWAVKRFGRLLRDTNGAAYVQAWMDAIQPWLLAFALPLWRPRHLLLAAPAAAVVAYGWWVGGDFMAYSRFYVVPTVLVAAVWGWLLADAVTIVRRRWPARVGVAQAGAVALALVFVTVYGSRARARHAADEANDGWLDGRWEGVHTMDRFAQTGLAAGAWMREHVPPQTLITVGAAGAVPYASGLQIVDAFGLVDPNIAHLPNIKPDTRDKARPGHQIWAPVKYIKRRDPDLLCHVGYRGDKRPTRRHVHRSFLRGYTWACIEPEPGVREQFYCCRRPKDRVVGPFGGDR